ncbi:hypothetical protein FOZ61_009754 [Perkinsus olseni]|uniref:Peptidase A1 domain-containing protein n=1 Tax=Perkinsus olseni TaxID=32597 RepID=A0A7J6L0I0_PEROL|nr:hypothetical protein FOZ61_009754 [Perkinsus olseni]KAF4654293.1 hypothetical protein FOL46_008782 [Perkinsus olseni]
MFGTFLRLLPVIHAFSGSEGQTLTLETTYGNVPGYGYALLGEIEVDGQTMHALIDTGTSAFFLVWDHWFRATHYLPISKYPNIGYYKCPGPCVSSTISTITYVDQTTVDIFEHQGTLQHRGANIGTVKFGLVVGHKSPDHSPPFHSIGLGISDVFALYLIGVQGVGGGIKTVGINQPAVFDTGADGLFVPKFHFDDLIKAIIDQASQAAGTKVAFTWVPALSIYTFDCTYLPSLPPIELGLGHAGQAPIVFSNYARMTCDTCSLAITDDSNQFWTLPPSILIGNYFQFEPKNGRVGVAPLRSR